MIGVVGEPKITGLLVRGEWYKNERLRIAGMRILKRDKFRCQECGLQSRPSTQVPHAWMVPVSEKHPSLVAQDDGRCLCPLCVSAVAINWSVLGMSRNGQPAPAPGELIYCPWFSQKELSRVAAYIISMRSTHLSTGFGAMASTLKNIDAAFSALKEEIGANVPIYRGSASDFARTLSMLPEEFYSKRQELIGSLRWWPNSEYWLPQGKYWRASTFDILHKKHEGLLDGLL